MGRTSEKARGGRRDELTGLLRARDGWTTHSLAKALGVSHRTIMRDLETLRENDIPVECDRGRGGGVRLRRSWGIGRLHLEYRETLDLLLSLAVMEKLPSPLLLSRVKSIRNKIALLFAPEDRSRIASLRARIWIGETASDRVAVTYRPPSPACLVEIHTSFFETRNLAISYEDEKGTRTHREIAPHFLFLNWPVWYLLAWDGLRDAARFFRIDRIRAAKILPEQFSLRDERPFLEIVEKIGESL